MIRQRHPLFFALSLLSCVLCFSFFAGQDRASPVPQPPPPMLREHAELDSIGTLECNDKTASDPEYCQQPESPCEAKSGQVCPLVPACTSVLGTYANEVSRNCEAYAPYPPYPIGARRKCKYRSGLSLCVRSMACRWSEEGNECVQFGWCEDSGIHEAQSADCD
jgi:hypothetical protein